MLFGTGPSGGERLTPPAEDSPERPSGWLAALEGMRVGFETMTLGLYSGLLSATPLGDGHAVLVLPGFATDDSATLLLRTFLSTRGYAVKTWDLGHNLDHRTVGQEGEHITRRIAALHRATGRTVSLVGWSLGGVMAREAARRLPGSVRQVVTLGSPFGGDPAANSISGLYEMLSGNTISSPATQARYITGADPLPVPSTAIYSKSDGIAAWGNCRSRTDAQTENVEVISSHFGMVANPGVFAVIADRLAQPEDAWRPFVRQGPLSAFYR